MPHEPFYERVQKLLLKRIGREYRRGDLIPTQKKLAAETGASLITVKRALDELSRSGLIESRRGHGTVVRRERVADDHAKVSSWTDSISGFGGEPRTAWCKIRTRIPPPKRARLLGMKARQQSVLIQRLRLVDGVPMCLMSNELPVALVPGLAGQGLDRESLYGLLAERYGLRPGGASEEVTARKATPTERRTFGADCRIVLCVKRHTLLSGGKPLEVSQLIAPAQRYRYRVQLTADSPA